MVATGFLSPVLRAGQDIRIELGFIFGERWLGQLPGRPVKTAPPALPELRIDDQQIVAQRKAEAFLHSVRHGAVRR